MNTLCLRLEARAPALRCHRAYEITVGLDLFGVWVAEMTYGRIGAVGRTTTRSFTRIEDAAAAVDASLRRRATLPRRLGVAYRLRRVEFEAAWPKVDLSEPIDQLYECRDRRLATLTITSVVNLPYAMLQTARSSATFHKEYYRSCFCRRKAKMAFLSKAEMLASAIRPK